MSKSKSDGDGPLTELARGFRKRTWVTAKTLAKVGLGVARRNLGARELAEGVDEDDAVAAASELLAQLDGLKGLSMKIGQMMAYLDSSLPPKAQRILAKLQFQGRAMAWDETARLVREELGEPVEALFETFEHEPFAAASIGQVHRARWGNVAVAVKVQYPEIERLVRADLKTVRRLTGLALALGPLDGRGMLDELASRLLEECDYAQEAANQRDFRAMLAGEPGVSVPRVFAERSARRVLTTELVSAADFYRFCDTAPQAAKDRAAGTIHRTCFRAIFHHCAYNADPHPGNYLFDEGGDVTLLDFGCVKRFDPAFIERWKAIARSVLDDDLAGFERAWLEAGFVWRRRRFDFAHQLEAMKVLYTPMRSREPFTFSHEFTRRVHDAMAFRNKNKLKSTMRPDWLFVNRLQFGLFSVLALLQATAPWGEYFREALELPTQPFVASGEAQGPEPSGP